MDVTISLNEETFNRLNEAASVYGQSLEEFVTEYVMDMADEIEPMLEMSKALKGVDEETLKRVQEMYAERDGEIRAASEEVSEVVRSAFADLVAETGRKGSTPM